MILISPSFLYIRIKKICIEDLGLISKNALFYISGELSMSDLAQYDYCSPRYQCVVIPRYTDPNVIYYPPCTRVLRCGGCAPSEVLTCAPKQTSVKHVVVREKNNL